MYIDRIRLNAMLDGFTYKGLRKADDLDNEANKKEEKHTMSKGNRSFKNFIEISRKINVLERLVSATENEDMNHGTDIWGAFKSTEPVNMLRIQIKSSVTGVEEFKNGGVFRRLDGLVIVINSNPRRKHDEIVVDFMHEYRRVTEKILALRSGNIR